MAATLTLLRAIKRYQQLVRSQYWSDEERSAYVIAHLERTLRAAAQIPFYARQWNGSPGWKDLGMLPVLQRAQIAQLNNSIRDLYPGGFDYSTDSSSGSTGMPAEFLFDANHQRGRFAARARYLRENGWNPFSRNVWLIYAVFRDARNDDEKLIHSRLRFRNHFISPEADLGIQLDQLCRLDPVFLYTFPSYLEILLDLLKQTARTFPSLKKVFTGAEVLEDTLRFRAKQLLGVDVVENYGSTEAFLAWECPSHNLHINAEHVFIEIADAEGNPVAPGEIGRVLVTTLENQLAPLIRYEIGDYAVATTGRCQCGRTLPLIGRIIGREMNLFRAGGRKVSPWHLATAVRNVTQIKQFQIVQNSVASCTVKFVADSDLDEVAKSSVRSSFGRVLGNGVSVAFERVREIPRGPGGKYFTAFSELAS